MLLWAFYSDLRYSVAGRMEMPPEPLEALCLLSETYGRAICREPQRVEAMLRDLCPEHKREVFLLVSALREQIVPDLMSVQMGAVGGVPEEVVVSRSRRKLAENLGLNEESASWAVDSWLQASRILAATPDVPLPVYGAPQYEDASVSTGPQAGLDWIWLALCVAIALVSAAAVECVAWFSLHHDTTAFQSWAYETGLLAAGLAFCGGTLWLIAKQLQKRRVPNHWIRDPNLGATAMLCEVVAILASPAVPVAAIALWAGEWSQSWHVSGHPHDLTFHFGRILQSLVLAAFLWQWVRTTIRIQGRLGTSAIGRRAG
jgi:hypothetical protein